MATDHNTTTQSAPQRVLVIDDCDQIRALVRARLRNEDTEVLFAAGGAEGLAMCREKQPDLVLLDVDMPDLSGLEVIKLLKADSATVNIAVIFLTGADSTAEKVKGFDLGAVDYITKPFDVTELRARVRASLRTKYLLDLLAQRAMIDGLTGLYNRAHFNERLVSEIALARRTGTQISLVMIDVDHFKSINDRHGHPFGDEVLRGVARALTGRVRASDVVCRFGGEEFAVILPNTDAPNAGILAEVLRKMIEGLSLKHDRTPVPVTASFGIADLERDREPAWLVETADAALYEAKHAGRNRISCRTAAQAQGLMIPRSYRVA